MWGIVYIVCYNTNTTKHILYNMYCKLDIQCTMLLVNELFFFINFIEANVEKSILNM